VVVSEGSYTKTQSVTEKIGDETFLIFLETGVDLCVKMCRASVNFYMSRRYRIFTVVNYLHG
jgi:hypothetical protein